MGNHPSHSQQLIALYSCEDYQEIPRDKSFPNLTIIQRMSDLSVFALLVRTKFKTNRGQHHPNLLKCIETKEIDDTLYQRYQWSLKDLEAYRLFVENSSETQVTARVFMDILEGIIKGYSFLASSKERPHCLLFSPSCLKIVTENEVQTNRASNEVQRDVISNKVQRNKVNAGFQKSNLNEETTRMLNKQMGTKMKIKIVPYEIILNSGLEQESMINKSGRQKCVHREGSDSDMVQIATYLLKLCCSFNRVTYTTPVHALQSMKDLYGNGVSEIVKLMLQNYRWNQVLNRLNDIIYQLQKSYQEVPKIYATKHQLSIPIIPHQLIYYNQPPFIRDYSPNHPSNLIRKEHHEHQTLHQRQTLHQHQTKYEPSQISDKQTHQYDSKRCQFETTSTLASPSHQQARTYQQDKIYQQTHQHQQTNTRPYIQSPFNLKKQQFEQKYFTQPNSQLHPTSKQIVFSKTTSGKVINRLGPQSMNKQGPQSMNKQGAQSNLQSFYKGKKIQFLPSLKSQRNSNEYGIPKIDYQLQTRADSEQYFQYQNQLNNSESLKEKPSKLSALNREFVNTAKGNRQKQFGDHIKQATSEDKGSSQKKDQSLVHWKYHPGSDHSSQELISFELTPEKKSPEKLHLAWKKQIHAKSSESEQIMVEISSESKQSSLVVHEPQVMRLSQYVGSVDKNGVREGKGKIYFLSGGSYLGDFHKDMLNGCGKLFYASGRLAYEGHFKNNHFHQFGKIYSEKQIHHQFIDYHNFNHTDPKNHTHKQKHHSFAAWTFLEGNEELSWKYYEGDYEMGMRQGKGLLMFQNGEQLQGEFHANKIHGSCVFQGKKGVIKGIWQHNILTQIIN